MAARAITPTVKEPPLTEADLAQFYGTENHHRFGMSRFVCSDGAKYLADRAGAYWLLDDIAIHNQFNAKVRAEGFQVWILDVDLVKHSATLRCEDGNDNVVFSVKIEYTSFPLATIKLYCIDNVILLPREY